MAGRSRAEELEDEHRLNQLYLAIISRYKEYIEEKEHISVAELPTLVSPKDEAVVKKALEIKQRYGEYSFKANFSQAAIDAFEFIRNDIRGVSMPLEFWLTPGETMSFRVGDVMDRNTLLCSLLVALGNPSAKVLVFIKAGERRVVTYYEFEEKAYMMDLNDGIRDYPGRDAIIKSIEIDDDTTVYEFNDKMYVDIS